MVGRFHVAIMLSALLLALCAPCFSDDNTAAQTAVKTVKSDFETFYLGKANLVRLGIGIGASGVFANTNLDREIRDWYQDDVRTSGTDNVAHVFKTFGTAYVTVPIYLGVYGVGYLYPSPTLEKWAQGSLRATLVGTPALLVLQPLLGGARPPESSHWRPFQDSHGVSGHAFIGGVPFITAAMMSENSLLKVALYGLSTMTAISRINDDAHYFSQAALGWYLAYLSCKVVSEVNGKSAEQTHFGMAPVPGGMAVTVYRAF